MHALNCRAIFPAPVIFKKLFLGKIKTLQSSGGMEEEEVRCSFPAVVQLKGSLYVAENCTLRVTMTAVFSLIGMLLFFHKQSNLGINI